MKIANKLLTALFAGTCLLTVPFVVSAASLQGQNAALQYVERGSKAKKITEAEMFFDKAIELDPDCAEAYFEKGNMYYLNSKHLQADENFAKVISLNPKYPDIHFFMARNLAFLSKNEQAIDEYREAIACNPKDKNLYFEAAGFCKNIGKNEQALEIYSMAISNKVDEDGFLYWKAKLYYDMGRQEEALKDFNTILEIKDSSYYRWAHQFKGRIYEESGNYQKAIDEYTLMLELWKGDGWAYLLRGYAYYKLGNKEKALEDFRDADKITTPDLLYGEYVPNNKFWGETSDAFAFYFYEDGQYHRALEHINKALNFDPESKKYKVRKEEILKAMKGFDKPKEL